MGRVVVRLIVIGLALALAGLLVVLTQPAVREARGAHAGFADLLAAAAAVGAWLVLLRFALAAGLAVLGWVPGAFGRAAGAACLRVTPVALRAGARWVIGGALLGAPAVVGPSAIADPGSGLPVLDRVVTAPAVTAPAVPGPAPATRPGVTPVVVRAGDSLWGIADRALPAGHGPGDVARAWPRWYAANQAVIGADPGLIHPGQRLLPPPDPPSGPPSPSAPATSPATPSPTAPTAPAPAAEESR